VLNRAESSPPERAAGKSSQPEMGEEKPGESPPQAAYDSASGLQRRPSEGGDRSGKTKKNPTMEVQDLLPAPPVRRHLLFDQAHRLATMPRQKHDDFTTAAFWSAVVTATSGIAGIYDILSDKPTQPKLLDLTEILIFGVCVAVTIIGVRKVGMVKTSSEYLNELYSIAAKEKRRKWYQWHG